MAIIRAISSWTPRTPVYYGWIVLTMAALGTYASTGVSQIVLGGVQNLISGDTGWDRSTIAFAVTAGTWTSGALTPVFGRLADRYGPRGLMPAAALVTGLCFFALAGSRGLWQFYTAYIVARAIGNPNLVGVVPRTVAVNFFQRRRNLALSVTSTVRPISGALNIQLISLIAVAFSWRAAYRYLGGFALLLVVPLYVIMRRRPEDIGLRPDGDPADGDPERPLPLTHGRAGASRARAQRQPTDEFSWSVGEAARTSAFWSIVVAEMLIILTAGTVSFQLVPFLADSGLSQTLAVAALSLSSLLGALVNPVWGVLADRYSPRHLALGALPATGAITVLYVISDGGMFGFAVAIAWGTASGGLNILGSMMLAQYFGRGSFGSITGLVGPFQTGALGLGPAFGAAVFGWTGGYTVIWVYGVAAYAAALVLIFSARQPTLPHRASAAGYGERD